MYAIFGAVLILGSLFMLGRSSPLRIKFNHFIVAIMIFILGLLYVALWYIENMLFVIEHSLY